MILYIITRKWNWCYFKGYFPDFFSDNGMHWSLLSDLGETPNTIRKYSISYQTLLFFFSRNIWFKLSIVQMCFNNDLSIYLSNYLSIVIHSVLRAVGRVQKHEPSFGNTFFQNWDPSPQQGGGRFLRVGQLACDHTVHKCGKIRYSKRNF